MGGKKKIVLRKLRKTVWAKVSDIAVEWHMRTEMRLMIGCTW